MSTFMAHSNRVFVVQVLDPTVAIPTFPIPTATTPTNVTSQYARADV